MNYVQSILCWLVSLCAWGILTGLIFALTACSPLVSALLALAPVIVYIVVFYKMQARERLAAEADAKLR